MKLAKLSLAAIVVAGLATSSFAADTLADAFKNGTVKGALKAYYMDTTNDLKADGGGKVVGGVLGYKTADFNGFSAGFEFQTSHTLGIKQADAPDGSIAIQASMLSEAYLAYTMNKTTLKIGRQHIGLPLLSDSGSRLIRDYFTGATVVNTSLENTTLVGGYITDWTDRDGIPAHFDTKPYTVYAKTSVADFGVSAQYLDIGTRNDYWVEGTYSIKGDMPINLAAQYIGIDNGYTSELLGFKVSTTVAGLGLLAAYTTTDSAGEVTGGIGQGKDSSYNSVQKLSGNGAGVDAYQGKISYNFGNGLSAFTRYIQYDNYDNASNNRYAAGDATEWDIDATYKFNGSLKGLTTQVRYAMVTRDAQVQNKDASTPKVAGDFNDFRFIVNYNF